MSLSEHKIIEIEQYYVRTRYPRLHGKNAKFESHRYGLSNVQIMQVTTDKGTVGFGLGIVDRRIKANLLGKRVSDVFDPAVGILSPEYFNADIALHDLAGKILGISVKRMISENCLDAVNCYDGSIYMNDISPNLDSGDVSTIIENCRYDRDIMGFKDFKIKIGRGAKWMEHKEGLKRDIDIVYEVRKNFPDCRILVDANDGYSLETTIEFMEAVKDCDIYWLEEPFCENAEDLKKLREYLAENSSNTLVADGEWSPDYIHTSETLGLVDDLAKQKLIDAVLMDTVDYGFTNWRKYLSKTAKELGVLASPHNWAFTLKTIYSSHLAAAFPDIIPTIEGVGDTTEGIDHSAYTLKNGMLTVPDSPGFGMELIWASKTPEM